MYYVVVRLVSQVMIEVSVSKYHALNWNSNADQSSNQTDIETNLLFLPSGGIPWNITGTGWSEIERGYLQDIP